MLTHELTLTNPTSEIGVPKSLSDNSSIDVFYIVSSKQGLFVCWLLDVLATCQCISGTDLLRQFYVLPR